jgi:hypothetical protein
MELSVTRFFAFRDPPADHRPGSKLLVPLFTCLQTPEQSCRIRGVTLEIEAERKLHLDEMAAVSAILGTILRQMADAATGYEAVVEPSGRTQYLGPDGDLIHHWGMAYEGGFVSSVLLRGRRRRGKRVASPA